MDPVAAKLFDEGLKISAEASTPAVPPNPPATSRDAIEYQSTYTVESQRVRVERRLGWRAPEVTSASAGEYVAAVRAIRADEAQQVEVVFDTAAVPEIPADATTSELYGAGDAAYDRKNYETAAAFWKRTVELDAKHKTAWDALALAYEQMKRPKEAVEAFRRQIEVNPFHSQAHKDLARVLEHLNDLEGARQALAKHVDISPARRARRR